MQRNVAIDLICRHEILTLPSIERQSLIVSWWSIDESDPEFSELPPELQATMKDSDPPDDDSPLFDSLVLLGLRAKYVGVRNEYLESKLKAFNLSDTGINGEPEQLIACPCCQYRTLEARGQYYICPVCFWEDSGQNRPSDYSSPNRMTLAEAQANFEAFGAISKEAKRSIDPDGRKKWIRDNES